MGVPTTTDEGGERAIQLFEEGLKEVEDLFGQRQEMLAQAKEGQAGAGRPISRIGTIHSHLPESF